MTGIYRIVNQVNGKSYIGLSLDIERRFVEHKTPRNVRKELSLPRAMRKYGKDNFNLEVLEECCVDDLCDREMFWIAILKPEYNRNEGGSGNKGHSVTEEVRAKLSAAAKSQWNARTPEQRREIISKNLTGPRKGRMVSQETKDKLRFANLGKIQAPGVGLKISLALRGKKRPDNGHHKQVVMLDKGGGLCGFFASVNDAATEMKLSASSISHAIHGRKEFARGHKWKLACDHKITATSTHE